MRGKFLLLLSICLCAAFVRADHVTTPSGQNVPAHLVREALPSHLKDTHTLEDHVFDISPSKDVLLGPSGFSLSLKQLSTRTVRSHPNMEVSINGKTYTQHKDSDHQTRILSGQGYSVVLQGQNARPLAVWGNGINLRPVHPVLHPYVMVNHPSAHSGANDVERMIEDSNSKSFESTVTERQATCDAANRRVVEISVTFDTTFCAIFSGYKAAAIGGIQAMFDEANIPYRRDTCLELALVNLEGFCGTETDPYAFIQTGMAALPVAGRADYIIEQFRTFFTANRASVNRDVAYFFFGFAEGSTTAGYAELPGTCDGKGFGWVEGTNPYVFAHEVGHNLNCEHTSSGIMLATLNNNNLFFAADSAATMKEFVESGGKPANGVSSTCLTSDAPSCDSTCPANCVNGKCVAPTQPGTGFVSCKIASTYAYCAELIDLGFGANFYFYRNTACPPTTDFVGVPFNASDPEILCCDDSGGATTSLIALRSENGLGTYTFNSVPYTDTIFPDDPTLELPTVRVSTVSFHSTLSTTCSSGAGVSPTPSAIPSTSIPTSVTPSASAPATTPTASASAAVLTPTASASAAVLTPTASASAAVLTPTASASAAVLTPTSSASAAVLTTSPSSSAAVLTTSPSSSAAVVTTSPSSSAAILTTSPSASAVVLTPTPSSSQPIAASMSASSSAQANPGTPGTCGTALTATSHLFCTVAGRRTVAVRGIGSVKVIFKIHFGTFKYILKGLNRNRVRFVRMSIKTDRSVRRRADRFNVNPPKRRVNNLFSLQISEMPLPSGRTSCCGGFGSAEARFRVRLCSRRGFPCRMSRVQRMNLKIPCRSICTGGSSGNSPFPMNSARKCPSCPFFA